jgi:hypothetical protein
MKSNPKTLAEAVKALSATYYCGDDLGSPERNQAANYLFHQALSLHEEAIKQAEAIGKIAIREDAKSHDYRVAALHIAYIEKREEIAYLKKELIQEKNLNEVTTQEVERLQKENKEIERQRREALEDLRKESDEKHRHLKTISECKEGLSCESSSCTTEEISDLSDQEKTIKEAEIILRNKCFYHTTAPVPVALLAGIIAIAKQKIPAQEKTTECSETYVVLQKDQRRVVRVADFKDYNSAKTKCEESAKYFHQECQILKYLSSCIPQAITTVVWKENK